MHKNMIKSADFWKRKLAAMLHDPPHKPLDFGKAHEDDAKSILRAALPGHDDDWFHDLVAAVKDADHYAAAADRFCFPKGAAASTFTGKPGETFKHPLGKAEYEIPNLPQSGKALEWLQHAFGGIKVDENADEPEQWRQRFFLYWRRFMEQTVLQNDQARDLAFYPADTRIPDHTIWNHMNIASALEGCRENGEIKPAFLIFQLGPVQDFIAAARSTRDLWSGSYMLAYLTANAIKAVTNVVGPDSIIFPALRGQGVFDILHQRGIYSTIEYQAGEEKEFDTLWHRMYEEKDNVALKRLLSPTLPNRFVALVPESDAEALGQAAEQAVFSALDKISEACLGQFAKLAEKAGASSGLIDGMKERWGKQVTRFPQVTWAATPWRYDIDKAIADFAKLPVNLAETKDDEMSPHKLMEKYREIEKATSPYPENAGLIWMVNYHRAEFALAARRNTRDFDQFCTDANQATAPKDALTGKEEIIGDEALWEKEKGVAAVAESPFKKNEGPYGAITIIKRLWWRAETGILPECLDIKKGKLKQLMSVESVADIAANNFLDGIKGPGWRDEKDPNGERKPKNPYVAVIALDGDEMGKWVNGAKTPELMSQVANAAKQYLKTKGDLIPKKLHRALTPSYHMQFSEALANFATYLTDTIVSHYGGQLVYSGGDDVLAIVPADNALNCARALRAAFRGEASSLPEEQRNYEFASTQNGFVLAEGKYPLIVPGPNAEVSVGIAFAHYQHPLQAIVREAQKAEKRAKGKPDKNGYDRKAFAVSLLKRGGETVHWGAKWDWQALELYDKYCESRNNDKASARFPYALAALLTPYKLTDSKHETDFIATEAIKKELETVFENQGGAELRNDCHAYLQCLEQGGRLQDFANLFLTAAFIERDRGE